MLFMTEPWKSHFIISQDPVGPTGQPYLLWERPTQGHKYQEASITGGQVLTHRAWHVQVTQLVFGQCWLCPSKA